MLRVAETVSTFEADLVALGEYEQAQAGALHTRLEAQYPHHALYPNDSDVALFSRYPIVAQRLVRSPDLRSPFLRAEVDVDGTLVTVYVVHLVSPHFDGVPWHYDDSARDREVALLAAELDRESGPLLLLCDCNLGDQSDAYRVLDRRLTDSFRAAGRGMGFTFPNEYRLIPPLVRIDYIWHSDEWTATDAYPLNDSGTSDHRPVVAHLALKDAAPTN